MLLSRIAATAATFFTLTTFAAATPTITCNQQGCSDRVLNAPEIKNNRATARYSYKSAEGVSFLPHPPGCPRRAFCACGAAVEIFGRAVRDLWPARAWYKFPRSAPGYKKVAVRNHHVFVLRQHIEGTIWLVADYNSGGHQSRLHQRDIKGYTIVDPNGNRMAMN